MRKEIPSFLIHLKVASVSQFFSPYSQLSVLSQAENGEKFSLSGSEKRAVLCLCCFSSPTMCIVYATRRLAPNFLALRCVEVHFRVQSSKCASSFCAPLLLCYLHSNYYSNFGPISVHRPRLIPRCGWVNAWDLIKALTIDLAKGWFCAVSVNQKGRW